jgi:plasmid stabilization system protein ParE
VDEFENWLVFYSTAASGIEIFRVKHGMMDLPKVLKRDDV